MRDPKPYRWLPLPLIEPTLDRVLSSWVGTPYMHGQRVKGQGVDCAQLTFAVMDELLRRPLPTLCPRMTADAANLSARAAFATILAGRRAFESEIVRDGTVKPGDIILTRATGGDSGPRRPGHAAIAAVRPGTCLHAVRGVGACFTSIDALPGVLRVVRPLEKHRWVS